MVTQSVRKRLFKRRRFRLLLVLLLGISGMLGLLIVHIERPNGGNISNYFDGIWWVISTITTVGYGDKVPITNPGRFLGMILMLLGVVMFGSIIAMVSSYMNRAQDEFYWSRLFDRLDRLENQIEELSKHTGYIVKNSHEQETTQADDTDQLDGSV